MNEPKTFRAGSMPEALRLVKQNLGPDAVILGSRALGADGLGRLVGAARFEITAMPARAAAPRERTAAPAAASRARAIQVFHERLMSNQVAAHIAERLLRSAAEASPGRATSEADVRAQLRRYIAAMVPIDAGGLPQCGRIAFVGPAGSGKTTTLAKLAAQLRFRAARRVGLLSLDVYRIGSCAQLGRFAELIGIPFESAATVEAVSAACEKLADSDVVLIDTPGVALSSGPQRENLRRLLAAARPGETHLVLPANMSAATQARACEVFRGAGATRIVLTKLDDAVGLGVILEVLEQARMKLSYVSTGPKIPTDIGPACGERLAELILP